MNGTYKVYFNVKNLGLYADIPGLQDAMKSELIRVYNMYADETNAGVTDLLNKEFDVESSKSSAICVLSLPLLSIYCLRFLDRTSLFPTDI